MIKDQNFYENKYESTSPDDGKRLSKKTKSSINIDELEELLFPAYHEISPIAGKGVFLVLGNTGAGKSTGICYLMGCKMEKRREAGQDKAYPIFPSEKKKEEFPEIGYTAEDKTLYPAAYDSPDGIFYADCPGFLANRGDEVKICATIGTHLAIAFASQIRGIIIVISFSSIDVRATEFRELIKTLSAFIKNPEEIEGSLIFVFTRVPEDVDEKIIAKTANEMISSYEKQTKSLISKLKSGLSEEESEKLEDLQNQIALLSIIGKNSNRIMVMNIFDDGASKKHIVEKLLESKPISKDYFAFNNNDNAHLEFKNIIYKFASEGSQVCSKLVDLPIQRQFLIDEKKVLTERLEAYKKINQIKSGVRQNLEEEEKNPLKQLKQLESLIKEQEEDRYCTRSRLDTLLREAGELAEKIRGIDFRLNDPIDGLDLPTPTLYWPVLINEPVHLFRNRRDKLFHYDRIPYCKVIINNIGYDLALLDDKVTPANGVLYIRKEGNFLKYKVINPDGDTVNDEIKLDEHKIPIPERLNIDELEEPQSNEILTAILKITSKKNHTREPGPYGRFIKDSKHYVNNPEGGEYKITYSFDFLRYGFASVRVFVKRNTHPKNIPMIKALKVELQIKKDMLTRKNDEIKRSSLALAKFEDNLHKLIDDQKKIIDKNRSDKEYLEYIKKEIEKNERELTEKIIAIEKNIQKIESELTSYERRFSSQKDWFEMIINISTVFDFETEGVDEFIFQFSHLTSPNKEVDYKEGAPSEFICPISQTIMLDPVQNKNIDSKCMHNFDRISIENYIQTKTQGKTDIVVQCPCCREPLSELVTNRTLKNLIDNYVKEKNESTFRSAVVPSSFLRGPLPNGDRGVFIEDPVSIQDDGGFKIFGGRLNVVKTLLKLILSTKNRGHIGFEIAKAIKIQKLEFFATEAALRASYEADSKDPTLKFEERDRGYIEKALKLENDYLACQNELKSIEKEPDSDKISEHSTLTRLKEEKSDYYSSLELCQAYTRALLINEPGKKLWMGRRTVVLCASDSDTPICVYGKPQKKQNRLSPYPMAFKKPQDSNQSSQQQYIVFSADESNYFIFNKLKLERTIVTSGSKVSAPVSRTSKLWQLGVSIFSTLVTPMTKKPASEPSQSIQSQPQSEDSSTPIPPPLSMSTSTPSFRRKPGALEISKQKLLLEALKRKEELDKELKKKMEERREKIKKDAKEAKKTPSSLSAHSTQASSTSLASSPATSSASLFGNSALSTAGVSLLKPVKNRR